MAWAVSLYCVLCGRGKTIRFPLREGEPLPDCDVCGATEWKPADQPDDQRYPYVLSHNDRRFLRALRIEADS